MFKHPKVEIVGSKCPPHFPVRMTFALAEQRVTATSARHGVSAKTERIGFLHLPAELRNYIYELTLLTKRYRTINFTTQLERLKQPGLLLTCRQIRIEASEIHYLGQRFKFHLPDFNCIAARMFFESGAWRYAGRMAAMGTTKGMVSRVELGEDTVSWDNLLDWLWLVREGYTMPKLVLDDEMKHPVAEAAARAFEIVEQTKDLPWDKVKKVLEMHRQQCNVGTGLSLA